jgi:N-acetylmuramoyl-L-alanine amidase
VSGKASPQTSQTVSQQVSAPKSVETAMPAETLSIPESALGLTKKTVPRTLALGANGTIQLVGIRYWNNEGGVVVALQLTGKTQVEAHRIENPDRIYFDLHNTIVWQSLNGTRFKLDGPAVRQIRAADRGSNITRVTLQLQNQADYKIKTSEDLNLLVIEVRNATTTPK